MLTGSLSVLGTLLEHDTLFQVASCYAKWRRGRGVDGIALFGAYPTPIIGDLSNGDIKAISLWGSLDGVSSRDNWEGGRENLPDDAKFVEIDGGNHSQMGYISTTQNGDNKATISRDSQQAVVLSELRGLLEAVEANSASRALLATDYRGLRPASAVIIR